MRRAACKPADLEDALAADGCARGLREKLLDRHVEVALGEEARLGEAQARCAQALAAPVKQGDQVGRKRRYGCCVVVAIDIRNETFDFRPTCVTFRKDEDLHRVAPPRLRSGKDFGVGAYATLTAPKRS